MKEAAAPPSISAIVVSSESTVIAEYVQENNTKTAYQSEDALEREFITQLQTQAYEYLPLHSETQLIANIRTQLETLNNYAFTDSEWQRFFKESLASVNDGIVEKTQRIQEDHIQVLKRDDGSSKNIKLIDKVNIHNNRLQVINQYVIKQDKGAARSNRYDVTVLVNGIPMVHIELKRRGVAVREAFNQIDRYQRDSFWAGTGLFDYVQLFVISNGTHTKYYSNTTRSKRLDEMKGKGKRARKSSNSFEFTSFWADATNKPILDLMAFAKTFFAKHSLLNVLTKYCVLDADRMLLVMRPYQIVATERILSRIQVSTNYKKLGTIDAGGYVWHTTGSGKTLTSFKTAQLATGMSDVRKVLFVVDRRDLDYQTMKEYDRFQKGAANSNTSTAILKKQLEDPSVKIIITTIQKLSNFIASNKGHAIYNDHIVVIFDECHRSQFGDMHRAIVKAFKRYNMFGFTGTPIFADNAKSGGNPLMTTTEHAFGEQLHSYTIVNAIADKNVLPFHVDYINTIKLAEGVKDKKISAINTEEALLHPTRVKQVAQYVLEHFDQKTHRNQSYTLDGKRMNGFNALFATSSIKAAKTYYSEFAAQQLRIPYEQRLTIGIIFSYAVNDEVEGDIMEDEAFDTQRLNRSDYDFLSDAIYEYNDMFGTSFDASADKFQSYYKDLSERLKKREIDLVIVVNMFLTGFDATTLNTLFVDKNLRSHGLIQAFSRTNRILNAVKSYGNIVSFRDLVKETDDAIALFGNKDAKGTVLVKSFAEFYGEYELKTAELVNKFPLGEPIIGEAAKKEFIALFSQILRLQNMLVAFDEFLDCAKLSDRQSQDYRSVYLDLYAEFKRVEESEKESIIDDVVFEIELIKQVEINVDYILVLVEQYMKSQGSSSSNEIRESINRAVDSSPTLRNKKDLIEQFVDSVSILDNDVSMGWSAFIEQRRNAELDNIIREENLQPEETRSFVNSAFRDGQIRSTGTEITNVLPSVSRFAADGSHGEAKQRVVEKLSAFFDRFFGLSKTG